MTESRRLKRIKAAQQRKLAVKISNEETHFLFEHDKEWFLATHRRQRLEEIKAIRVFGGGKELTVADAASLNVSPNRSTGRTILAVDWYVKQLPPVKVEKLPLYIYNHLCRKYRGQINKAEFEYEFWDLIQPWVDDHTVADNIIGGLELEKELLPSWSPYEPEWDPIQPWSPYEPKLTKR